MAAASASSRRDTGVGKAGVQGGWVIALTALLGAISLSLVYSMVAFWPNSDADGKITGSSAAFLGQTVTLDADRSLLVLVILAGATGGSAAVLRSFFKYAGERKLIWSWVPMYLLTPIVGALLALFMYIVVRAGLLSASGVTLGNPFGFAAVATLVGLFSAQAAEKLKEVFETIFAEAKTGRDPIDSTAEIVIQSFDPDEGKVGDDVTLVGRGLEAATSVTFGGGVSREATWDASAQVLRTSVPPKAQTGALSVSIEGVTGTSVDPFIVLDDIVGEPPPTQGGDLADTVVIAAGGNGNGGGNGAGGGEGAAGDGEVAAGDGDVAAGEGEAVAGGAGDAVAGGEAAAGAGDAVAGEGAGDAAAIGAVVGDAAAVDAAAVDAAAVDAAAVGAAGGDAAANDVAGGAGGDPDAQGVG